METAVSTSAAALDAVLARIVAGLKPGLAARGIDLARISVQGKALAVSEHFLPLTSEPAPDTPSAHVRGLSSAALAGVILGAVVLLLALAGGVAVWRREERREATERRLRPANEHQAELHRLGPADDEAPPDLADPQPTPACVSQLARLHATQAHARAQAGSPRPTPAPTAPTQALAATEPSHSFAPPRVDAEPEEGLGIGRGSVQPQAPTLHPGSERGAETGSEHLNERGTSVAADIADC